MKILEKYVPFLRISPASNGQARLDTSDDQVHERIYSLAPGRCGNILKSIILKLFI